MRKLFECKRCGYGWYSSKELPITCPHCRSAYWNVERKNKTGGLNAGRERNNAAE